MIEPVKCLLISDFTIDPLAFFLKSQSASPPVNCAMATADQVRRTLQDHSLECWQGRPECCVVWTLPDRAIPGFAKLLYDNDPDWDVIRNEVEEYAGYVRYAASNVKVLFVPLWTLPSYYRGGGVFCCSNPGGAYNTLMRMNLLLAGELEAAKNVYVLNSQRWMASVAEAEDERMWFVGKIPFSRDLFLEAAKDIKAAIRAVRGKTRKILVLDLDNTLWGGTIGDVGMEGISLGGIDPVGEAFRDFQKHILALKKRGILLAISSKNEESAALEALDRHPEMILRREDFVDWRINWNDKASNIADMIENLNLGLQSAVFIDDNPSERNRVSEALPEVYVPDWPSDPILYSSSLNRLDCFDITEISREDRDRTSYYHQEKSRKLSRKSLPSYDQWLRSLKLKAGVEELNPQNMPRAVQLLNKTNQFNLTTRRMDYTEFESYASDENNKVITFRVSDRFGDYGIVGLLSLKVMDMKLVIEDFVLSCRAMGLGIEKAMLYIAAMYGKEYKKNILAGIYLPTAKNKPCADFLTGNGFEGPAGGLIENRNLSSINQPRHITICRGK